MFDLMKKVRQQINFRATAEEIRAFTRAAKVTGLSLSSWLRQVARKAAGMKRLS